MLQTATSGLVLGLTLTTMHPSVLQYHRRVDMDHLLHVPLADATSLLGFVGCWLLVFGCWLLVVGCWPLVVHRLPIS